MKKIAFSDKYGLTRAVIEGRKTMTRRIIPDIEIDWNRHGRVKLPIKGFEHGVLFMDTSSILPDCYSFPAPNKYQPRYEIGEVVAVAQRYEDVNLTFIPHQDAPDFKQLSRNCRQWGFAKSMAGWSNKMFVRADLMPNQIRITGIKVERLQDISDEDSLREGIRESIVEFGGKKIVQWTYFHEKRTIWFDSPREAFAALIDRISGRGTWERNPWTYAYEFELVKMQG